MSEYIVTALTGNINFAPASVIEEILQNVRFIMTTPQFSVPLDRAFGVSATFLDTPLPVAKSRISAELVTVIQKYEPRAMVKKITFTGNGLTGQLVAQVVITIND